MATTRRARPAHHDSADASSANADCYGPDRRRRRRDRSASGPRFSRARRVPKGLDERVGLRNRERESGMPHHPHGIEAANRIMEQDTHSSGGGRPEREPTVGERATRPDRCEPAVWAGGAGVTYVRKLGLAGPRTEPRDQTISGEGDVRGRRRDPEECEQTANRASNANANSSTSGRSPRDPSTVADTSAAATASALCSVHEPVARQVTYPSDVTSSTVMVLVSSMASASVTRCTSV